MEEIDLEELLKYYKNKLGIIIIVTALACIVGCIYGAFLQKPMYSSYTTVILGKTSESDNSTITQSDISLNQNLVDTYAEIVKSRKVLTQVIDDMNLDYDYSSLASKISVSSVNDTEIIKITVNTEESKLSKEIANCTAKYFIKEVKDLYSLTNVNVLDEAYESKNPYNINVPKQSIICFMVGIILSCGGIFVMFYFDRTVKTTDQVETKTQLPILGSVQLSRKVGK